MQTILNALKLIFLFDAETYNIILLSLKVSILATLIGGIVGALYGLLLSVKNFRLKNILLQITYTLCGMPPVVLGLIVFLLLSRNGVLGSLQLVYTPTAMIIAQTLLIIPVVSVNVYNFAKKKSHTILNLSKTLGGNSFDRFMLLITELKSEILASFVAGFARAISEVGAVTIVGGNIKNYTRVMTTTISMQQSMGNYDTAIALGIVLLLISFIIQSFLYKMQGE